MAKENSVRVNIFGSEYSIKSDSGPEYIRQVARYVDSEMRNTLKAVPSSSAFEVAILTALNLMDELFKQKKGNKEITSCVEDRVSKLTDLLGKEIEKSTQTLSSEKRESSHRGA